MSFSTLNLDPSILKAIQTCGYSTMTPIQAQSIPSILNGSDLVASAQTGTGKTAAFVLPALHHLSLKKAEAMSPGKYRQPRILILTPTRELASQITQAAGRYGKFLQFNIVSLVGGMPYRQQLRDLSRHVDVIVATPGRLLDHMDSKKLDLSEVEMLVLDEADRMLDMGFIDDVQAIAKATPHSRQTLLFSATVDNKLSQVVKHLLKNPIRIDFSQERMAPTNITQELYLVDNPQHRAKLFQHMLDSENIFKAIIFTATKIGADKLAGQLVDQGYAAGALHGDLKQSVRNRTLEQLKRGKLQFLVATDVAARGIDVADMSHVFNFDLPRFCEDYVHRIGRTGRAGKVGKAISFALPNESRHVQRIEKYIGSRLQLETIAGMEPKSNHVNPNPPRSSKGRGGKSRFEESGRSGGRRKFSEGGRRRSGEARTGFAGKGGNESSRGRSSFSDKSDRADSDRGRTRFSDKSDRIDSGWEKSSFSGRSDRADSSRGRSRFSDKSDRADSGRGKSNFSDRSDRANSGRGRSSFSEKPDRVGSGRSRSSFSERSDRVDVGRGKSSFSERSDRTESGRGGRSEFGRSKPGSANRSRRAESGHERSATPQKFDRTKSNKKEAKKTTYVSKSSKKSKDGYKSKKD